MARPPFDEAAMNIELSTIINDFLSSSPSSPSLRRSRSKRFGGMWRFAARAVIKKRSSPSASAEEILSPVAANLISPLHRKLLSDAFYGELPMNQHMPAQQSHQRKPPSDDGSLVARSHVANAEESERSESFSVDIPPFVVSAGNTSPVSMPESVCASMASTDVHTKANRNAPLNGTCSSLKNFSGRKPHFLAQHSHQRKPPSDDGSLVARSHVLDAEESERSESFSVDIPPFVVAAENTSPVSMPEPFGAAMDNTLPVSMLESVGASMASTDFHTKANRNSPLNGTCSSLKNFSSRKPPRPPRLVITRSGSYRAARIKAASAAARKATVACVENTKHQRSRKPSTTRTTFWAFIVTLVFITIVFVQAFWRSREAPDLKFELEKHTVINWNDSFTTTLHP